MRTIVNYYQYCLRACVQTTSQLHTYSKTNLLLMSGILLCGLLMLTSASVHPADIQLGNPFGYLLKQLGALLLASLLFIFVYRAPLTIWPSRGCRIFCFTMAIAITLFPLFQNGAINGAHRWIDVFGFFRIHSAEISRPFFLAFFATCCYRATTFKTYRNRILVFALGTLIVYAAILLGQRSFTLALIIVAVSFVLLFLSGLMKNWLVMFIGCIVLFCSIFFIQHEKYRQDRVYALIWPDQYADTTSYQPRKGENAIYAGGLFGRGLGDSSHKSSIPEPHTDFILAVMFEEIGLLLTVAFVITLLVLLFRLIKVAAYYTRINLFAGLFGIALLLVLVANSIINFGFTVGLLPVTGLPFPLLSYGGSFLLYTFFTLAIALRIEYEYKNSN